MKIYEIIMEARAESLASKYRDKILDRAKRDRQSGVSDEKDILSFVQKLEDKFKRYVEWVLLRWLGGNFLIEDMPRVEAAIAEFDAKKRGLERKDINQYRTLSDLEDAVGLLDHVKSARQQKQEIKHAGLRKIVDNDRVLLVHVKTEEAAILIGRGTSWCTAYTDKPNQFNDYNNDGPIYVLIDKATNEKFQIHYESAQVMDSYDDDYDYQKLLKLAPQLSELDPGVMRVYAKQRNMTVMYLKVFHAAKRNVVLESEILSKRDHQTMAKYSVSIMGGEWPEAEKFIMREPRSAYMYAYDAREGPWEEAEPYIMRDPYYARAYAEHILDRRWPEAESYILNNTEEAVKYYRYFFSGEPWAELELKLGNDPDLLTSYAIGLGKRLPPSKEKYILEHGPSAYYYAVFVIKGRWPEAEYIIRHKSGGYWPNYVDHFNVNE